MPTLLQVDNISVAFDGFKAINGLSFDIGHFIGAVSGETNHDFNQTNSVCIGGGEDPPFPQGGRGMFCVSIGAQHGPERDGEPIGFSDLRAR